MFFTHFSARFGLDLGQWNLIEVFYSFIYQNSGMFPNQYLWKQYQNLSADVKWHPLIILESSPENANVADHVM